MMRFLRSAFVIARRDFSATVLSKAFIFFLLGPLFPLILGAVFGGIGANVATRVQRPVVAVVMSVGDFEKIAAARSELVSAVGDDAVVQLLYFSPSADRAAQEKRLLSTPIPPVRAVLSGDLRNPRILSATDQYGSIVGQLRVLVANAKTTDVPGPKIVVSKIPAPNGSLTNERQSTALYGQMLIFFLTLFLAGMVMSQLIEEKSNKIIEVIAAAVPIDAMFVGKLFAMLAASVIGILVWIATGALFVQMMSNGGVAGLPTPAVGWPGFLALSVVYFATNYLLIGSVMLTIGAQASSAREVQVLAMPATFGQFLIFGLASRAIGFPDSPTALMAAIFPLSSPMTMLARAAQEPVWWPHLAAILWQALWVGIIIRFAAQLFRKTVLKSGPRTRWWRFGRA